MNIFRDIDALPEFKNAVVTIGSFDGVHRGHQRILKRLKRLATEYKGESVVITFDRHPRQVLSPWDETLKLLTTIDEKLHYLKEFGVDNVILLPFTVEFSQIGPREYVERFLIGRVHAKCLVIGYDHRFGRDRQGNFHLLQSYANAGHFDLVQIPRQEVDHIAVSSTKIRDALSRGDLGHGNRLLNHPYRISGQVVSGQKIGRSLGYPTANIKPQEEAKLLPAAGVYAAFVHIDQVSFSAMLYIGTRPTFNAKEQDIGIEVHLLDFNQEIYGERIEVDVIEFMRSDLTLDGPEALASQIGEDERAIRSCLATFVQMRQMPSVAIVALNYNGAELLGKYLPSFLNVTQPNLDIIVADNCSTDDSCAFIEQYFPDIQLIKLDKNYGYAEGYNRALANLDYDYYALVNTDVELTPHWLSRIITEMERDKSLGACQPKIRSDRERGRFEYAGACGGFLDILGYPFCAGRILHSVEVDVGQYDNLRYISWASGAALVVRSDVFHTFGGFDGSFFAHQEEIDLCWTLQRAGYRLGVVPEAVIYHLGGATLEYNSPGKVFLNFRNNLTTITRHMTLAALVPILGVRLLLDLSAAFHYFFRGEFENAFAVLRAYIGFMVRIPSTFRRRGQINRQIKKEGIGASQFRPYRGSILLDYYILGKKFFSQLSRSRDVKTQRTGNPV
jgi:riboflavin kinase/FMN adenylyltransferase